MQEYLLKNFYKPQPKYERKSQNCYLGIRRILFVITKSNWGGAQRYVFDLATHLPKDIFSATVALGGEGLLINKLVAAGIPIIKIASFQRDIGPGQDWQSFWELIKIFRQEKPDVVHLNSSKAGGLGALAARLCGIPKIIYTAHGWAFNEDLPWLVKTVVKFFSWFTAILATDIIVLSDWELEQTKKMPFVASKVHRIYNGLEAADALSKNEARAILASKINRSLDFLNQKIIVGTISELHPNKGLDYATQAVAALPESLRQKTVFIIIGDGEEKSRLTELVAARNLQNQIFMTGFIENASSLLPAFDIFTLASLKEGLPYVALEAALANLPMVASAVGGIPEIIGNDWRDASLTAPKDVAGIAARLERLIADSSLRQKIGAILRLRVQTIFTLPKMLEETVRVYQK